MRDRASEALTLQIQKCEQIAQRILWSIQSKDRQTGGTGSFPIALRIIADMKDLIRFQIDKLEPTPENLRIGLVRSDFAGNKNMRNKLRDAEVLENEPQTSV